MAQEPSCCDTEWDLLRKIVLQLQSMATGSGSVAPFPSDAPYDLWRKILINFGQL